jgi:hypothetical protein
MGTMVEFWQNQVVGKYGQLLEFRKMQKMQIWF